MPKKTILLSLPGLREADLAAMPRLRALTAGGQAAELVPSFPCVTCPVQAAMTTGQRPNAHGIVANGLYWRDQHKVEMWTAPNQCIEQPQIWSRLEQHDGTLRSAAWFPMHSKNSRAEFVCTPAPIHNPDGSESLWCYTRPTELYGELRDALGHFPLMHYWGPMANVRSSQWIADSAAFAARRWQPELFYIYLPHLDYAAQRSGPDGPAAAEAVAEMDAIIGRLADAFAEAYDDETFWLVVGEYAITPVNHVTYPNRVLREAGLLAVREEDGLERLDLEKSLAWAMVDHQFSHVFIAGRDEQRAARVADLFRDQPGVAEVLVGDERARYAMDHDRSGEVIVISTPESWQAYYWWTDDAKAPSYARTVDIHRKPGYDPVELFFDPASRSIPLDATLIGGSHGAPAVDHAQQTVMLTSEPVALPDAPVADTDVFDVLLRHFGIEADD